MAFTTLMSTAALAARVDDPAFAIVDCRFALNDVAWGRREYLSQHIPGAVYADLDHDLSGPKNGRNGRHPLPDPKIFADTLGRFGISSGIQVVAYDQDGGMYASRLWWMLRWMGHDSVAVLDGGFEKWLAEKRPARPGDELRAAARFAGTPRDDMWVPLDRVARLRDDPGWHLVDARAPERFRGDEETIDPVGGHIPGAANQFFRSNLSEQGIFKTPEELRSMYAGIVGPGPIEHVVCYCGSGVTACHNLLALEHAGLHGAKLYPGSWSEWCSDPSRPIAKD